MKRVVHILPFILVLATCIAITNVGACPSCKEAYIPGSKEASIGESYSYSVVYFLGMFISLLFGGAAFLKWKISQALRLRAATQGIDNQ